MTAIGHMPFPGHRTQKEVREDEKNPLSWCPPDYRAEYDHIRVQCGFSASEARTFIEKQIEVDGRRSARA